MQINQFPTKSPIELEDNSIVKSLRIETIPEHRHIFYDMRGIMTCVLWSEGGVYWNDFDFKVWEAKRLKGLRVNEDGVKQTNSVE